jgi:hypothetical protein
LEDVDDSPDKSWITSILPPPKVIKIHDNLGEPSRGQNNEMIGA